jgi:hypothetical protein
MPAAGAACAVKAPVGIEWIVEGGHMVLPSLAPDAGPFEKNISNFSAKRLACGKLLTQRNKPWNHSADDFQYFGICEFLETNLRFSAGLRTWGMRRYEHRTGRPERFCLFRRHF